MLLTMPALYLFSKSAAYEMPVATIVCNQMKQQFQFLKTGSCLPVARPIYFTCYQFCHASLLTTITSIGIGIGILCLNRSFISLTTMQIKMVRSPAIRSAMLVVPILSNVSMRVWKIKMTTCAPERCENTHGTIQVHRVLEETKICSLLCSGLEELENNSVWCTIELLQNQWLDFMVYLME